MRKLTKIVITKGVGNERGFAAIGCEAFNAAFHSVDTR